MELIYELSVLKGDETIARIEVIARGQGWTVDRRTESALDLSRRGYRAIVRELRDDQRMACEAHRKAAGEPDGSCGGRLTVFAE
ncbi:hypothetical protein AYO38_08930 [bacterium SCGC AG-212-C10]|nr:hypothetical protein AYO38_08930 [bacterium SCGC AG-212-C10]